MQKLLIADCSRVFTAALTAKLQDRFQIMTCADGQAARELLHRYQPDVLILNLMLPYIDGLTLLQKSDFRPPVVLATTMYMSAYVEQMLAALDIDYTMIAPSVDTVVLRLRDLLARYSLAAEPMDLHEKTVHHLRLLNFPTHLDGYRQLCLALPLFAENPQQFLTKELYPTVAKLYGCKDSRSVEHSIRKAIHAAWQQRDNATWRKFFSPGPQGRIPCPTNKEFICRLAEILNTEPGVH